MSHGFALVYPEPGAPVHPFGLNRIPGRGNTYAGVGDDDVVTFTGLGYGGNVYADGLGWSIGGALKKVGKAIGGGAKKVVKGAVSGAKKAIGGARDIIAPPVTDTVPVEKKPFLTPLTMAAIALPVVGIVAFVALGGKKRKANPRRRRRR